MLEIWFCRVWPLLPIAAVLAALPFGNGILAAVLLYLFLGAPIYLTWCAAGLVFSLSLPRPKDKVAVILNTIGLLLGILQLFFSGGFGWLSSLSGLHEAVSSRDKAAIKRWIAAGRDLNITYNHPGNLHEGAGIQGETPLMLAAGYGYMEGVQLLVEAGADLYRVTSDRRSPNFHQTAIDYAIKEGQFDITVYLWEKSDKNTFRKSLSSHYNGLFNQSCGRPYDTQLRDLISFLLQETGDSHSASEALWSISRPECLPLVEFLLKQGVPANEAALITAAANGALPLLSLYLDNGVDVNGMGRSPAYTRGIGDFDTITPLVAASGSGQRAVVEYLLSRGADIDLADSIGRTPLIAAVKETICLTRGWQCDEDLATIELLLDRGARLDITDSRGKRAEDYIAFWKAQDISSGDKARLFNRRRAETIGQNQDTFK